MPAKEGHPCPSTNTASGTARSSSSRSRPRRRSTSSPNTSSSTATRSCATSTSTTRTTCPTSLEKIQKEGLIEQDGEGKWQVSPKGVRRIQENALTSLFQTFQRDALGKHDTPQKGEGTVRLEDSRPYVYGDSLANLNLHETLKNAYVRQGGGVPIRLQLRGLRRPRDRVPGALRHGRPDRHERVDGPLRQVRHDQEGGAGLAGDGPRPVRAGLAPDGRVLHLRQPDDRAPAAELGPQAGRACSTAGSTSGSTSTPRRGGSRSTSPTSTPGSGWRGACWRGTGRRTSRSSSSPTASRRRTSRGARSC